MPVYVLYIKVSLDGVASLQASESTTWILDIQSTDESEKREGVYVSGAEELEVDGSKGKANFVVKFKGSNKQSTISVVDVKKLTTRCITAEQSGEWVPVVAFDCRGLVPTAWHPSTDFVVTSSGGHSFGEVDLSDGDWGEYDEENDIALSITDMEHKFEARK
eukprot:TRINITY_DN4693_c0_g2_i1.p1 TRINITY_DN4693_c0_g2~~TRINITY_DN4693_c0_g2_i1.p1  ORF type:complete len:174 (+),score=54.88 TRINITY_DN4693_c0_g2_i1:39-524(+)